MQTGPDSANAAAAENSATLQSPRELRRVAFTALIGTSIEWYDFFLYGTAAALIFPVLFFPPSMPPLVAEKENSPGIVPRSKVVSLARQLKNSP